MNALQRVFQKDGELWYLAKDGNLPFHTPARPSNYHGYVYAIEIGQCTKIGYSQDALWRVRTLAANTKIYGGGQQIGMICISKPHTNFISNEAVLHKHFRWARQEGELFELSVPQFLEYLPKLSFLDESEEKAAKAKGGLELLKGTLFNDGTRCEKCALFFRHLETTGEIIGILNSHAELIDALIDRIQDLESHREAI